MKIKRILAILFSLIIVIVTPGVVSAKDNNYNLKVLENSEKYRIVQTNDEKYTYLTKLDKVNNTIQTKQINNANNSVIEGNLVYINGLNKSENTNLNKSILNYATRATGTVIQEWTYTNYEYKITLGKPTEWVLIKPGRHIFNWEYFETTETYKNKSYLNSFKKEVDKLDFVEKKLIVSAGVTALSTMAAAAAGAGAIFTGGTLSPTAWASIAATAGAGAVSLNLLLEYDRICKDAYYYYMRVWNLK